VPLPRPAADRATRADGADVADGADRPAGDQGAARFRKSRAAILAAKDLAPAERRRALSDLCDAWLTGLLGTVPGAAIVAVGGYGRRELLPGSDLDVVLLHDGPASDRLADVADQIFYPVWDARVALDHSVRSPDEAREVAAADVKVALGLIDARHVAGERSLTERLRQQVLADWRSGAARRLPQLGELVRARLERHGELAYLLEPDLVEAYGGLRDTVVLRAVAASWLADHPHSGMVDEARAWLLAVREALHLRTGRRGDRLVLQEQDDVAAALGLLDADALLRRVSEAGRVIGYASEVTWRAVDRALQERARRAAGETPHRPLRTGLAEGVVEQGGEVVLAREARPDADPLLPLRAAAAAAQHGLTLAPHTVERLALECPPLPVPWPAPARDHLVALLGAGRDLLPVWESLEAAGLVVEWLPDWERIRFRPQRSVVHRHTVDRHSVQTCVEAAALARRVSRPDLLLLAALLHDLGKGWPGDHSASGAIIARETAARMGLPPDDAATLELLVRHHLLLPDSATRRDLDDPATVEAVVTALGSAAHLDLLAALTEADALAAGPLAWTPWRSGLVRELVARVRAVLGGEPPPTPARLDPWHLTLARLGELTVLVDAPDLDGISRVTVVAPDRPGLLAVVAGLLSLRRLEVRGATVDTVEGMAVHVLRTTSAFGPPPDEAVLREDLRQALDGRLDVTARLAARAASMQRHRSTAAAPRVTVVADASRHATVLEVRAHDEPGLLHRVAAAVAATGTGITRAVVGTLGADAVDVLYVVGPDGGPLPPDAADELAEAVRSALAAQ
jgi:[protein-PII] uridylyltransferase